MKEESRIIDMATEERKVRDFGLIFYIWLVIVLAAYAFGAYSIYQLTAINQSLTNWVLEKFGVAYSFVESYIWWVVLAVVALLVIGILIAYLEVWLMSYAGAEIVNTVIFGGTALLMTAGVFLLVRYTGNLRWIGIAVLAPAAFIFVIVLLLARRIILGSKVFEMSNEAVNEEKGTLIPVLFFSVLSVVTIKLNFYSLYYQSLYSSSSS